MPRFNHRGELAHGPLASWLDDDRIIRRGDDGVSLVVVDRAGQVALLDRRGANFLAAGGGRWVAQVNGVLYGNVDTPPGAVMSLVGTDGRGGAARDGTLAVCADANCAEVILLAPDRLETRFRAVAYDLQVLSPTAAVWRGGSYGVELPRPALPMTGLRIVGSAGVRWLVGWVEGVGLVAQIDDQAVGWVLESRPRAFHHDVVSVPGEPGFRVGWSSGVGELPGEQVVCRVSHGRVEWLIDPDGAARAPAVWGSLVPPVPDVPAIGRPCLLGWFTDGAQDTPGNADLFVDYRGQPASNLVRLRATGAAVARYVAAEADGGLDALNAACRAARQLEPRLPVIAYCPAGFLETKGAPRDADIVGIEAYRHCGESLDQFTARIGGAIGKAGGFRLALIPQDYISNEGNDPDVAALVPAIARLAIASKDILAILPFSAGSRPGGWADTPEAARQAWRCLASGIPGTPVLPSPDPLPLPPVPPVPVTRFPAARVRRGVSMRVFLKCRGRYVGVEPGTTTVYADRDAGAAWEEVDLMPLGAGFFLARFVAADRMLSIQPDGSLETRPAGTDGAYEQLRATSQPEGLDILYRADGDRVLGAPLVIVEA